MINDFKMIICEIKIVIWKNPLFTVYISVLRILTSVQYKDENAQLETLLLWLCCAANIYTYCMSILKSMCLILIDLLCYIKYINHVRSNIV